MLEITTAAQEAFLGIDFAELHKNSELHKYEISWNKNQIKRKSSLLNLMWHDILEFQLQLLKKKNKIHY